MTSRIIKSLGIAVATVMLFALAGVAAAGQGTRTATLAPNVSTWLETSTPDGRLDSIVTFRAGAGAAGMDRLRAKLGSVERLESVPMAHAWLSAADIREIAAWPETRSIWDNEELELHLDDGTRMVKADRVWAGDKLAKKTGYRGTGVGVAVFDTGVDTLHPDLPYGTKVKKSFYVAANPVAAGQPQVLVEGGRQTDTEHGHGTHVSSTIAGTGAASAGQYQGVAPDADLYVFKVGAGASVFVWWAARSFDWVITNGPAHNIRAISNSWGGGYGSDYNPDDPINVLSKAAYDANIVTVFSAGNGGGPNRMGRNAVSPHVVSVGAANKDFTKAPFSSVGRPGGDWVRDANGLYRPTITAPGVNIMAAHSSLGLVMAQGLSTDNPFYTSASGTSMSAPHVSGVVALIVQARPSLTAQNVIDILEGTAVSMPAYEVWEVGAGFVDAWAAVRAAEKGKTKFPPSTKGKTPAYQLLQSGKLEGVVLPGGYALLPTSTALVNDVPIEVGSDVDAIYAEINWTVPAENIYLFLLDPSGTEVASSTGLTDVPLTARTLVATAPDPGTWTLRVAGRVNGATQYTGFYGMYAETKPAKVSGTTTSASAISGDVSYSADAVHDSSFHEFTVPAGATGISAAIAWGNPEHDIDLYIYDPNGKLVGSSTNFNPDTGQAEEAATAASSDPLAPGTYPAGTWQVEIRGYLVTDPQEYSGSISITAAQ